MTQGRICVGGLAVALAAAPLVALIPAHAEEAPPPRLAFDLGASVSQSSNPDLLASGGAATTDGALTFGLAAASDTRDQKFRLRLGSAWSAGAGVSDPGLTLSYARTGAHSAVSVQAQSIESAVDLSEPQTLADGSLNLSSIVATTGRLRASSAGVDLQSGMDGPLGFALSAKGTVQDYAQTSDPSVYDSTSASLSGRALLRQVAGGDLGLNLGRQSADFDDAAQTQSQSTSLTLSWDRALDAATRLSTSLGQTSAKTEKAGVVTNSSDGLTGALGLTRDLGAGQIDIGLGFDRDAAGVRQSLRLGRSFDLATTKFSAELGWSTRGDTGGAAVGKLAWAQTLPQDALSLSLTRQVALNTDDADTLQTSAAAEWRHKLTDRASLGLGYGLGAVSGLDALVDGSMRQTLTASWSQQIARDWALTTGVTLRQIDRDSTGRADDASVFLTIGHTFVLLP
jgi:hypothetical protein